MSLRLRPYRYRDEAAAVALHEAMLPEDFHFLLGWEPTTSWSAFLQSVDDQRRGLLLSEFRVPALQLVADLDGELVGRSSIRFVLNEFFAAKGGHIGYGVAPTHRRKGFATEILRQALVIIRANGVERVLVTCSDDNLGSSRVIERNGGVLETVVPSDTGGPGLRRYWID